MESYRIFSESVKRKTPQSSRMAAAEKKAAPAVRVCPGKKKGVSWLLACCCVPTQEVLGSSRSFALSFLPHSGDVIYAAKHVVAIIPSVVCGLS